MLIVCDLDGVVWLSDELIPGAPEAVERLRAAGHRVLFATNFSFGRLAETEAKLARFGIPAGGDVVTSAMAAATLVEPGETALVCAGPGVREALEARGATAVDDGPADVVVVGYHTSFDYERMRIASTAVRNGARFVATNDDATYPTPAGPVPGAGALVASVAVASGVRPLVAGKPHRPMAELVRALGAGDAAGGVVMVGDRADTDGRFALTLGGRFALVLTGVERSAEGLVPEPDLVAADLLALSEVLVGEARPAGPSPRAAPAGGADR